jgi:GDSL-like Lipase/Acylhydrolase family
MSDRLLTVVRPVRRAIVLAGAISLAGCGVHQSSLVSTMSAHNVQGRVKGGSQPITNAAIQLYAVGTSGPGSASTPLLTSSVTTDSTGSFSITGLYTCPSPTSQVYVTATGGNPGLAAGSTNPALALMAAVGSCSNLTANSYIYIDEVSTVSAVVFLSPYMASLSQIGSASDPTSSLNVTNAFINSAVLLQTVTGTPAFPTATITTRAETVRSLANSLAGCVNTNGSTAGNTLCAQLFAAATPAGQSAPADTIQAALDIVLNPTSNVGTVYQLAAPVAAFQPALTAAPNDWTFGFSQPPPTTFADALNSSTVFMGDSITAYWPLLDNNKGIPGNHASEMLARFQTDVMGHGYARVVILAGTNDILVPIAASSDALNQIASMAQMASGAGMQVILCEVLPFVGDSYLNGEVVTFNATLINFAATNNYLLVDYYTPMAGQPQYFNSDAIHPNAAGYTVMEATLSAVLVQ